MEIAGVMKKSTTIRIYATKLANGNCLFNSTEDVEIGSVWAIVRVGAQVEAETVQYNNGCCKGTMRKGGTSQKTK